jgi:hypothetical protein
MVEATYFAMFNCTYPSIADRKAPLAAVATAAPATI